MMTSQEIDREPRLARPNAGGGGARVRDVHRGGDAVGNLRRKDGATAIR